METATALRDVVEPLVTAAGLELWDVEAGPGLVRVLVDRQGGVDLDDLGQITRVISNALDAAADAAPAGRYHLEVSSPGAERTLRTPEQYRRFLGSTVSVKTIASVDGDRRRRGLLASVDDAGITLVPEDGPAEAVPADVVPVEAVPADVGQRIEFSEIEKAHTVLVWGPAPKPGSRRAGGGGSGAARLGVARPGVARPGPERTGPARPEAAQPGVAQPEPAPTKDAAP